LPLRTNIIPKSICFDTPSIIQNLLCEDAGENLKNYKKGNIQHQIWSQFFDLNKKVFKKNKYQFHYMIRTDAISISILFIRLKDDGTLMKKMNKKCRSEDDTKYIENVPFTNELNSKRIVCV